ncbi:hypothetical protein [Arthrobacter celericrescens]|uniref:hypothetical protein n=1 Tax=Arthrobacter celericrescens TaxID=2320851 RepID=UPI000EA09409|nr:hypothetical protein [Arthrobacter celericrescens]
MDTTQAKRVRRRSRLELAVALSLAGTAGVAGCSTATPQPSPSSAASSSAGAGPVAESFAKYDAVRTDVVAALEKKLPGISWTVSDPATMQRKKDGSCFLYLADMKSPEDIVEPSKKFQAVFDAVDPVLKEHGFEAFGGTDKVPGGWMVASSTDGAGASLSIESKGMAYVRLQVPVTSADCNPKEIPAG